VQQAAIARVHSRDSQPSRTVYRQIVALACEGSVNVGEHQRIVEETIEHRDVTGELGLPEFGLAGQDFIIDAHPSSEIALCRVV
jgi:hypothetical protein